MPATDAPLAKWMFLHLLHGLSQSGYAMAGANELLGELDKLPPQQQKARVLFGTGLLRQALLLNPLDAGLRGLVGQLGAMAAPSPAYAAW
ncbi:glycosyl transferase family 2, partial [Desulfovibrio oxamicus]|nr:glycosyl transferase family 2 [Nitratidesulfovibrio oxamicus]